MGAIVEGTVTRARAKQLDRVLKPFAEAAEFVAAHYDDLLTQYPEQWVAVSGQRIVAASQSRVGLKRRLRGMRQDPAKLYIGFLTGQRHTLIL